MAFSGKREIQIKDVDEMNNYLGIANKCTKINYLHLKNEKIGKLILNSYIYDSRTEIRLTTRYIDGKPATYVFQKTGREKIVSPINCYRTLTLYSTIKDVVNEQPELFSWYKSIKDGVITKKVANSAKALIGFNPKFHEGYVYCYDLNSAYGTVLRDKIIDTYSMVVNKDYTIKLKENQVGFMLDRELTMITRPGTCPDVIFDLIESPYRKFIDKYYKLKKEAGLRNDIEAKEKAKAMLNYPVGCSQNHNPFFRAYIVHTCNNYIRQFIKKYKDKIVTWNTDAVYSTVRIPEIESNLGNEIGQWKLEYEGLYRQKGNNHQKVEINDVSYRGTIKELFTDNFNILTDKVSNRDYIGKYNLDYNTLQIIEVNKDE